MNSPATAQTVPATESSMLESFKRSFANNAAEENTPRDPSRAAGRDKLEALAKELEVDYATAKIVASLKNPFMPQIPSLKKTGTIPKPHPVPIETPPENYTEPQAPPPQFNISGMIWNTKIPAAIINGHIVKIGDEISSWQVAEINQTGVRMVFQDQELWIKPRISPDQPSQQFLPRPTAYGR